MIQQSMYGVCMMETTDHWGKKSEENINQQRDLLCPCIGEVGRTIMPFSK